MKPFDWWTLLAHSHWVTAKIVGRRLRLCARCTGATLGFTAILLVGLSGHLPFFKSVPLTSQLGLCLLLAAPASIDWFTQTLEFRESNNVLRILTGLLEGVGVGFLSLTSIPTTLKIAILIGVGATVINFGFAARTVRGLMPYRKVPSTP